MPRPLRLFLLWLVMVLGVTSADFAHAQAFTAPDEPVRLAEAPPVLPDDWERVSAVYLEVYGAPDSTPVLLDLSRHGSQSLPELSSTLGVAIGRSVHVVVAPTQRQFFALQPGDAPEWADGTAYPGLGHVYLRRPGIRGPQRPLTTVLDHELVHVLLGRAFAPERPPRWLQEGIAQVYAGEMGPEVTRTIARAAASPGGLMSLEELTIGFPADPRRAQLAYALSADFVSWFTVEYGEDALRRVIADMRGGADVRAAMRGATGKFLDELDREWRARLARGSSGFWLSAFSSGDIWWGVTALVAMIGLVLARFRIKRRMDRLAEQERVRDAWLAALWRGDDPTG